MGRCGTEMVVALRRGLMVLISASPPTLGALLVRSSASLSSLCRHSSWEHRSVGSAGRTLHFSAFRQSNEWPIYGISRSVLISRRAFHDLSPTVIEREGLLGFDDGFKQQGVRSEQRGLWWKRTPILEISRPSGWRERSQRLQRNRLESVGYRHGNIWEADREGRGEIFSRALSNSTGEVAQIDGDGPNTLEEIWEGENGDQRGSNQGLENLKGYGSNRSFVQLEGSSGSSQVPERPSRPPFKPGGNSYEKLVQSRGESGDRRSSGESGRPPSNTNPDEYEKHAPFNGVGDVGSSKAIGRPPLEPKSNDTDKLSQSTGGEGENASPQSSRKALPNIRSRSFARLKAWYAANMGPAAGEGTPVKSSKDLNAENPQPRNPTNGDGPQSGYKSTERGTEHGKFRWVAGPQNRGSGGRDSHSKRVPLQESGALGRQTVPESSSGRNSFNSKQTSPEEEKEEVVRKYPPRRVEGKKNWKFAVKTKQMGLAGHSPGSARKVASQWADDGIFGNEPEGVGRLEAEEGSSAVQGDSLDQGRGFRQNKLRDSSDENLM